LATAILHSRRTAAIKTQLVRLLRLQVEQNFVGAPWQFLYLGRADGMERGGMPCTLHGT
jgi:hypothetical protein